MYLEFFFFLEIIVIAKKLYSVNENFKVNLHNKQWIIPQAKQSLWYFFPRALISSAK